ncbi:MAG: sensor histidine kinase [Hyphomonas sp.]|nr:sensor histidine kinase [Hyphomonas sp.]
MTPDFDIFAAGTSLPLMVLTTGLDIVFVNRACRAALGRSDDDIDGLSVAEYLACTGERAAEVQRALAAAAAGQRAEFELEVEVRAAVQGWRAIAEPVAGASGAILLVVVRLEKRPEPLRVQPNRDQQKADEDHRVKNLMATILATARISAESAESVEQYTEDFCERLDAMMRVNGKLPSSGGPGLSLRGLFEDEIRRTAPRAAGRCSLKGPDVILTIKSSRDAGMVIHELATNALRHGCFSRPEGRLAIGWTVGEDYLTVTWEESGLAGISEPERTGFGTTVLSMFPNADVQREFRDSGLRVAFRIPSRIAVYGPDGGEPH